MTTQTTRSVPAASIIIPTYNRSTILDYTLHSLTLQTLERAAMEVIVVDDGSSDDTREVVQRYGSKLNLTYIYQEDKGRRVALARNKGIERAAGEVCVFIDSGMILAADCIRQHLEAHREPAPRAVIGYAFGFEEFNDNDQMLKRTINTGCPDATIAYFNASHRFLDLREEAYRKYGDKLEDLPAPWVFFWTCNVSARTEDLRKVGLFDENFDLTWGFEDIELAYRLQMAGVRIVLHRPAAAIHYPHGKEDQAFKTYCQQRNKYYFHEKHNSRQTKLYLDSDVFAFNDYLLQLNANAAELPAGEPAGEQMLKAVLE